MKYNRIFMLLFNVATDPFAIYYVGRHGQSPCSCMKRPRDVNSYLQNNFVDNFGHLEKLQISMRQG